ncbi:hypothetical protein ScPMuIL_007104 [Solemya velum]
MADSAHKVTIRAIDLKRENLTNTVPTNVQAKNIYKTGGLRSSITIAKESGADEDLNDLETEENPVASINVQPYSFEPYESDIIISSNSCSGSSSTNGDIGDKSHMVTWTTRHEDIPTQPTGSWPDGLGASLVKR